ncbi:hypothetical protein D3C72_2042640 [compost metagenome]
MAGLFGTQRCAAQALQVRADDRHPGVFFGRQFGAITLYSGFAFTAPDVLCLLRVTRQIDTVSGVEKIGLAFR